jgi:hypothetical protein
MSAQSERGSAEVRAFAFLRGPSLRGGEIPYNAKKKPRRKPDRGYLRATLTPCPRDTVHRPDRPSLDGKSASRGCDPHAGAARAFAS